MICKGIDSKLEQVLLVLPIFSAVFGSPSWSLVESFAVTCTKMAMWIVKAWVACLVGLVYCGALCTAWSLQAALWAMVNLATPDATTPDDCTVNNDATTAPTPTSPTTAAQAHTPIASAAGSRRPSETDDETQEVEPATVADDKSKVDLSAPAPAAADERRDTDSDQPRAAVVVATPPPAAQPAVPDTQAPADTTTTISEAPAPTMSELERECKLTLLRHAEALKQIRANYRAFGVC